MVAQTDTEFEMDRSVSMGGCYEEVPEDVLEAVREAFEESIGHMVDSRGVHWHEPKREHEVARFTFSYFEMPVGPGQWVPPYRCREEVEEELRDRLPDGYTFEAEDNTTTGVYTEVSGR